MRRDGEAERDIAMLVCADSGPVTLRLWQCLQLQTAGPHAIIVSRHRVPLCYQPLLQPLQKASRPAQQGECQPFVGGANYRRSMEKEMLFIQKANMSETAHGDGVLRHDDCDENIDAAVL